MTTATRDFHLNSYAVVAPFGPGRATTWRRWAAPCLALLLMSANGAAGQSLGWVKQAGGTISTGGQSVEDATAIASDSQGNSYVTGTFRIEATFGAGELHETVLTGVGQDVFVAKYDPNGLLVWAKGVRGNGFNQDFAWGIAIDSAGNSYVTGWLAGDTTLATFGGGVTLTTPGAFVAKFDAGGTAAWATTLNANGVAYAISVTGGGDSFVAGSTPGPLPGALPLVTVWKIDANGTTQWTRSAAGAYSGAGLGISVDSAGNSSVTGEVQRGTATFGVGEPNQTDINSPPEGGVLFVAKYDASGTLLWARQSTDQPGMSARGNAIASGEAGNSYLVGVVVGIGTTILGPGEPNQTQVGPAFVAKYDGLGTLVWARSVAPPFGQVSWLFAVASNSAGDTYLTGTVVQGVIFIQKYGSSGDLLWTRQLAGVASSDALALQGNGISLDSGGNARVAGQFSGTARFGPAEPNETLLSTTSGNLDFDIFVAKYRDENVPPVANGQSLTTSEDVTLLGTLSASDANADSLTYQIVSNGTKGRATVIDPATGAFTYVPNPDENGADSFTFSADDGTAESNVATVTVMITPVNDPPVASAFSVVVASGAAVSGALVASDIDSSSLSYALVSNGTQGTAVITTSTGAFTYTANAGSSGTDTFSFTANDGLVDSDIATVTVTIQQVCATDVSALVSVVPGNIRVDRKTGRTFQKVTLRNVSAGAITGPLSLILDALPAGASVVAPAGITVCATPAGSPYVFVDVGADGLLSARERASVEIEFANAGGAPISYTPRVLAGPGGR